MVHITIAGKVRPFTYLIVLAGDFGKIILLDPGELQYSVSTQSCPGILELSVSELVFSRTSPYPMQPLVPYMLTCMPDAV